MITEPQLLRQQIEELHSDNEQLKTHSNSMNNQLTSLQQRIDTTDQAYTSQFKEAQIEISRLEVEKSSVHQETNKINQIRKKKEKDNLPSHQIRILPLNNVINLNDTQVAYQLSYSVPIKKEEVGR